MEEDIEKLRDLLKIDTKQMKDSFQSCIDAISSIFRNYSVEDVAKSIFVSNMWLPNIASPVKHQFLTAIFTTLKPEEFSTESSIKTYDDFKEFLKNVYKLIPSFSSLEDYIPEPDCGEIKFHCDRKNYRMFYGNELSNVHEYLMIFQMIYEPYENEYGRHAQRKPKDELRQCLSLQGAIIEGITGQPKKEDLDISLGNLEIPPEKFWENTQAFYSNFKPEQIVPEVFIKRFSVNLGEYPKESLGFEEFGEKVFSGALLPKFFVKHESRYFPILPRRYSSILFDNWAELFQEYSEKIEPDKKRYALRLGAKLHRYIKNRISTDNIFPVVSAVTKEGKPHETIFTTAFISGNKLILIYLTEPCVSSKNTEQELNRITPELKKVLELVTHQPTTLALHLDRQNVQFPSKSNQSSVEPEILTIIPQVSTQIRPFSIPKDLPGRVMFLDSFLGIIDELEYDDTLAAFLEYLDEIEKRTQPILSMLDKFASFKDSYGTLVGGALEPDFIMLDPHWGTGMRYQTLAEFWKIYPEIDFFGHPRTWRLKQETDTRIRFEARGYFGSAIYSKLGPTNVFLTAPFHEMEYQQGNLSNLLMECLEDSMSRRQSIFKGHQFFKQCERLQVNFFPVSMVMKNERFKHLRHLSKIEKYWCSDIGRIKRDTYGIRVVFNEDEVQKAFTDAQDCSFEVDILVEVLNQLNKVVSDPQMQSIIESLEKTKSGKARFKMFSIEKPASFPEFISALEPKPIHFKKAKKRIAELARKLNINEGEYALEDAKNILNDLRDVIVGEINSEVTKYDVAQAITFLLARVDALNADFERHRYMVERGLEHEIDYQPEVRHAEHHTQYVKTHKTYRYLIEKFVQLEPTGKDKLGKEQFQYLIALIDWLQVFYSASDNLHYGILPVGMKLDREYLVEVVYEKDMEIKDKSFSEVIAQLELGLIGNPNDRVDSPRPVKDFLDALDAAFVKDLGFGFQNMVNVLQILCFWPAYAQNVEESTSYRATMGEIEDECVKNIRDISSDEVKLIIDFLTLKKDDVVRVLGQDEQCQDLPVWEYRKRFARYNLKPLIKIGNQYHWGPYSTRRTGLIWSGTASTGAMPTDLQAENIEQVLRSEKKLIEDALADRTYEIVKRYTSNVRKNLKLHDLEPKGSHPPELGDYDVLSFHPENNIILSIECKDILPPYCLKDAKRLREKIFGRPGKDQGHFEQINKRKEYLKEHIIDVATALNWPVDPKNPPKIMSIYLSRRSYWWTNFPPKEIEAEFLRVDLLSDFIQNLKNN